MSTICRICGSIKTRVNEIGLRSCVVCEPITFRPKRINYNYRFHTDVKTRAVIVTDASRAQYSASYPAGSFGYFTIAPNYSKYHVQGRAWFGTPLERMNARNDCQAAKIEDF